MHICMSMHDARVYMSNYNEYSNIECMYENIEKKKMPTKNRKEEEEKNRIYCVQFPFYGPQEW